MNILDSQATVRALPSPAFPITKDNYQRLDSKFKHLNTRAWFVLSSAREARRLADFSQYWGNASAPSPASLYAAAHIFVVWDFFLDLFGKEGDPYEAIAIRAIKQSLNKADAKRVMERIQHSFSLYSSQKDEKKHQEIVSPSYLNALSNSLRSWILLCLANENPAFIPLKSLFPDAFFFTKQPFLRAWKLVQAADLNHPVPEWDALSPLSFLRQSILASPYSLEGQLRYILSHWGDFLGGGATRIWNALDTLAEENRPSFQGPGPSEGPGLAQEGTGGDEIEERHFSNDDDWMPRVVLIAKNILVWLDQLSLNYGKKIKSLDSIPNKELEKIASQGFNALWLIGIWERSDASRVIKERMGNPEAAASAYALFDYNISPALGGWEALYRLRNQALSYGIRLASDMVPNHVGIDSDWVRHHPHRLLRSKEVPFPRYSFDGQNISSDESLEISLEDGYWNHRDAAVVFRRIDKKTEETDYIYHGNDGTTMPWNDTAQIDFLNPEAREAVIQEILHVADHFPLIRFDAAMVLTRRHVRRLWHPALGGGGAIPSRSDHRLSDEEFQRAMPQEFWREVVDRIASESPGTLLLAEAFWMMEGYFVRTLGMHRVYNSAFMTMLRDQKNKEYRKIIKETLAFEPGILQRFVNFMNNPDEESSAHQFGKGDKYFAISTLLCTLPGLPMFGHGQIEGFFEKYGMEYQRAYYQESPDKDFIARHEREIFPLLKRRNLFSQADSFRFFDLNKAQTSNENVYAYTNRSGSDAALIIVNNNEEQAQGFIQWASPIKIGEGPALIDDLVSALGLNSSIENADWLLLREMISGLWFLRKKEDLLIRGLSILIKGYGQQCYVEFRAVSESPDKAWAGLAKSLGEGGIVDPDAAILALRFQPFKEALRVLLPVGKLEALSLELRRKKSLPIFGVAEEILPALELFKQVLQKIYGERSQIVDARFILELINQGLVAAAGLWKGFFGWKIRRALLHHCNQPTIDEALFLASWAVISPLFTLMPERPARLVWKQWDLEDCLKTTLRGKEEEKVALIAALRMAFVCDGWIKETLDEPQQLLYRVFRHSDVLKMAGVNTWEGITWYREEGWYLVMRTLILSAFAGFRPRKFPCYHYRFLFRLMKKWSQAHAAASYHFERLLSPASLWMFRKSKDKLRS